MKKRREVRKTEKIAKKVEKSDEQLYVDLLWLEAQVHPEPAVGEYLPTGLKRRLRKLHTDHFPPLQPLHVGKLNEKARDAGDVINLRFQNSRNGHLYKRMVIDLQFDFVFVGKVAKSVVFVPSDSEALLDNKRNRALITFLQIYKGEVQVCTMPHATCMHVAPTCLLALKEENQRMSRGPLIRFALKKKKLNSGACVARRSG